VFFRPFSSGTLFFTKKERTAPPFSHPGCKNISDRPSSFPFQSFDRPPDFLAFLLHPRADLLLYQEKSLFPPLLYRNGRPFFPKTFSSLSFFRRMATLRKRPHLLDRRASSPQDPHFFFSKRTRVFPVKDTDGALFSPPFGDLSTFSLFAYVDSFPPSEVNDPLASPHATNVICCPFPFLSEVPPPPLFRWVRRRSFSLRRYGTWLSLP